MPYYHFRQNNSGGSYIGPENILIQADSAAEANLIAENNDEVDIYFDGVNLNQDCSCCGDRWYRCFEHDTADLEDYPHAVVISNPKIPKDIISKEMERKVAADLLAEAGFDDIAQFLRSI